VQISLPVMAVGSFAVKNFNLADAALVDAVHGRIIFA